MWSYLGNFAGLHRYRLDCEVEVDLLQLAEQSFLHSKDLDRKYKNDLQKKHTCVVDDVFITSNVNIINFTALWTVPCMSIDFSCSEFFLAKLATHHVGLGSLRHCKRRLRCVSFSNDKIPTIF